jgi:hypothetical protein
MVVFFGARSAVASGNTVEFVGTGPVVVADGSATATVHNFTGARVSVDFRLTWPDLRDPTGHAVSPGDAFTITRRVAISAGSEKTVHVVRVDTQPLAAGDYAGTLRFSSPDGFVDRIAITMTVGAVVEVLPLESPVTTWAVISERSLPWGAYSDQGASVPLGPAAASTSASPTYQTTLLGSKGGSLIVLGQVTSQESYPYLKLTLLPGPDGAPPGTYTGTLDLAPDDDTSGAITLTVQRRDGWFLPALILALALLIAWLSQRWWSSGRRLSQLKGEADAAKKTLSNGTPPPVGGLQLGGVSAFLDEAGARRKKLARRWAPTGPQDEEMIQAEADVRILTDAASLWTGGALRSNMDALQAALDTIKDMGVKKPPGAVTEQPALVQAALPLLSGVVNIEKLAEREGDILEATILAKKWPELRSSAVRFGAALTDLEGHASDMSIDERRLLTRARELHAGVLWDLWHAETGSDLLARHTALELESVDEAIGRLSYWLGPPPSVGAIQPRGIGPLAADAGLAAAETGLAGIWRTVAKLVSVLSHNGTSTADQVLIRTLDASFVLLAFAVSVWGAMVLLYFDKPFGGWRDYLGLIAWALGTTAALDIINGAVGKLTPPKPADAKKGTADAI